MFSFSFQACAKTATSARSDKAIATWTPKLETALAAKNLTLGNPVFFRILKTQNGEAGGGKLQAYIESSDGTFTHFKSWEICTFSGALGPKEKQGDGQSPEGFYFVTPARLNPHSSYHLSFNLGYPNAFDRAHDRTGDFLMVHGDCVSIGCYAMTDEGIEEIYTLLVSALKGGQPFVRVHAFPFEMSQTNMDKHNTSPNYAFWKNLKEGWDHFEFTGRPPNVEVKDKRYVFDAATIERELCFQKIKQAYNNDITAFILDDRDCLEYLPDFVQTIRARTNPH